MTLRAELPDGRVLEFPDGTPDEVIDRVARTELGVAEAPAEPSGPELTAPIGTAPYQVGDRAPGSGEKVGVGGAIARAAKDAPDAFQRVAGGLLRALGERGASAVSSPASAAPAAAGLSDSDVLALEPEASRQARGEAAKGALKHGPAATGERWFREATERLAENYPNVEQGSPAYYAYLTTQAMLQMGPAVIATLVTKKPNVGIAMMGGQVGADKYAEARERGLEPAAAAGEAAFYAATEGLTEKIPLGILMRGGKSMLSRAVKSGVAEGLQEPVTEALQMAYEAGFLGDDVTPQEGIRRLYDAGVIGFLAGGGLSITTEPFVRRQRSEEPGLRTEGAEAAAADVDPTQPTEPEAPTPEPEPTAPPEEPAAPQPEPTPEDDPFTVTPFEPTAEKHAYDDRILDKGVAEGLRRFVNETGYAGAEGGTIITDPDTGQVTGRNKWLPTNPELQELVKGTEYASDKGREKLSRLIERAINGEKITEKQAALVAALVDLAELRAYGYLGAAMDDPLTRAAKQSAFEEADDAPLTEDEDAFAGRDVAAMRTRGKQGDLFGGVSAAEQLRADREAAARRRAAAAPDIESTDAPLFDGRSRQTDIEDATGRPEQSDMPESGKVASFQPGEAYVGFREQGETAEGAQAKLARKPIRREDILGPFLKALNVRLYQGRIPKRSAMQGYYRPKKDTVRLKKHSDLEVTAHELAHYLDYNIPEIREQWTKGKGAREIGRELKGVSYDTSKVYEGFAEFVRLWMTQPEKARAAAPKFHEWWEGFVERHKHGPAIRKAREGMQAWYEQGLVARAQSKIGPQRNVNEALDSLWDRFRQSIADDLHGILRMERDLTGENFAVAGGPYETARLARAAYSVVDGALRFGAPVKQPDGSFRFEGKGLKAILDQVDDIDTFTQYAVGRSASELLRQGREHLFTKAEVSAMLQLETPEYARAFNEYQVWNRAVVDFAESMGIIDPAARARWSRQQYIPFYRVDQSTATKRAKGIEGNVTPWHKLTGGTGNLRDVLGNMIQNASMLIAEGIKNEARVRAIDFAWRERQHGGKYIERIPTTNKSVSVDTEQVRKSIYRMLGIDPRFPDPDYADLVNELEDAFAAQPGFMQYWLRKQAPQGDNVVAIMRGGKPEFYEVADPMLLRSLQAMNRPQKNVVLRGLNYVRRIGQGTITFTLDFMAANLWRDTLSGWVYSRHGFKPFKDSLSGMATRIAQDETYREYIANGGGMASYMIDPDAFRKRLEKFYTGRGIDYKSVIDTPNKLLYALEIMGEAVEMSTRLGEYKKSRAGGSHPRHAAYLAREVSTDFGMRGDSELMGWLYDSVIFLKAGVNGVDRWARGVATDPHRGKIALRTGAIAMVSVALYLVNRDDERYQDLEDWDRDTHWHVFIGDLHLRFPKIWEIGALASSAERTMEAFLEGIETGYTDGVQLAQHVARIFFDLFKMDYVPHAVEPMYEVYALNRERFTDRPIETRAMEGRQPFARYSEHTSRTLVELARATRDLPPALQMNPARMEALLRGYFNTYAMYGLMVTDQAFHDEKIPALRQDQYPVLRRFYKEEPYRTRYSTEFWELYREIEQLQNTANFMARRNRPEDFEALSQQEQLAYHQAVQDAYGTVMDMHRAMDQVYMDDGLSPQMKREALDELQTELNTYLKAIVTGIREDMERQ